MSRLVVFVASTILLAYPTTPVRAQSWEASGLVGYTPSSALDRRAPQLSQLDVSGGFTWGVQGARFFTPHWGAEALWMQQSSAQRVGTAAGSADLFTLTAGQLHGNVVYRFGGADRRLQPFAFAGLGATFFRSDDVPSETRSRSASAAASNTSSPGLSAFGRTSATNRPCSTTRRRATSAFRSDSVRERCSRSSRRRRALRF